MIGFIDAIGMISGACFAMAAVPSAIDAVKTGQSRVPKSLCMLILSGVAGLYTYLTGKFGFDWIITVNYATEFLSWLIVFIYRLRTK